MADKLYQTRFYKIWSNMKTRCSNHNSPDYKNYGARGVCFCDDWINFQNFKKDLYLSYLQHSEKHGEGNTHIDRINNDGDYNPLNVKWSTKEEQCNNRRSNTWITIKNETKTFAEWCKTSCLKASTIRQRFYCYGWEMQDALEKPAQKYTYTN